MLTGIIKYSSNLWQGVFSIEFMHKSWKFWNLVYKNLFSWPFFPITDLCYLHIMCRLKHNHTRIVEPDLTLQSSTTSLPAPPTSPPSYCPNSSHQLFKPSWLSWIWHKIHYSLITTDWKIKNSMSRWCIFVFLFCNLYWNLQFITFYRQFWMGRPIFKQFCCYLVKRHFYICHKIDYFSISGLLLIV